MSERFETELRGGYPDDGAPGVTLGSPMREGEVLFRRAYAARRRARTPPSVTF